MHRNPIAVAALLLSSSIYLTSSALAADEPPKPVPAPPAYTPIRWNEDYSYLKNPALRTDPFDAIKYLPLNSAGDWYASFGGQVRYRYENFNNNNFGAGPQDDDGFHLTRLFAHIDLHLGPYFHVFAQGKSAMEDGRDGGPRPQDADEIDIQQLFADVKLPLDEKNSATFRFGRQDLIYGAQRLISPLDWTNARRTFEGAKVSLAMPGNTLDLFWVRPVLVDKEQLNDGDGDSSFAGVYDVLSLPSIFGAAANTKLDLYGLALNKTVNAATAVDSDTYTLGARFSTNPTPWDVDIEADYQFGQSGSGDIFAWSFAAEGGYTFAEVACSPRTYLGFDIASGDRDPADPDKQTFNQLFPLGHLYFGYIDVIGRQNIIDLHPGVEVTLAKEKKYIKRLGLRADYHIFSRQSNDDAVYNAAGGVLRADSGSDATSIGSEVDLLLTWQIERHTLMYFGYSHFFAGNFIKDTGPGDDIDFLYAALQFTF